MEINEFSFNVGFNIKDCKIQALGFGKSLSFFVKISINSTNVFQTKQF